MARANDIKMEVTFDRQARDSIRSLVSAIDRLSDAIVNGEDVETLVDDPENVATLRRLVEDVKANQNASSGGVSPERSAWLRRQAMAAGYANNPPVKMHDVILPTGNKGRGGVR